jgi:hypothetical protein
MHADRRLVLLAQVTIAPVLELELAVGKASDPLAEAALGVVHGVLEGVPHHLGAELLDVTEQPLLHQDAGAVLGVDLGDPLLWDADVHRDQVPDLLDGFVRLVELQRRHPQTLGVALGRARVEGPVHGAADVGPVAESDREGEQLALPEDRPDDLDVVLVGAAGVGVVVDVAVARRELGHLLDQVLHGGFEGPHVRRLVALPVGDETALRGQDRDRVVVPLGDRRRV